MNNRSKISFSSSTRGSTPLSQTTPHSTQAVYPRKIQKKIENEIIQYEEIETQKDGMVRLYTIKYLHSVSNPAVRYANGDYIWYYNGKIHRDNGPAYFRNGILSYYKHGVLHREDGPAITYPDGRKQWYINGILQQNAE